jgi:hypothetical protein
MKKVLLLAIIILVVACTKENDLVDNQIKSESETELTDTELKVLYQMRNENNKVGLEEATKFANDVIAFLDGDAVVKSGVSRSISSITPVRWESKSVTVKSTESSTIEIPDTVAYIFNFGEDDGYAIISADTRIDASILAYAGNGSLDEGTDNPGLGLFLEGTEDYILQSIVEAEQRKDSLINDIITKLDGGNDSETKSASILLTYLPRITSTTKNLGTTAIVTPLSPVEWGQGNGDNEPFWRNVRNKNCSSGTSPAGCVAIATAHIMSYWKYPTSIDGKSFNWSELNQYTGSVSFSRRDRYKNWLNDIGHAPSTVQTQAANLIECIGSKVKMSYGCGSSSADSDDAIKYLKNLGYKAGSKSDYSYNTIKSSLNSKRPVYIRGNSSRTAHKFLGIVLWYTYSGGHAWVVDGYLEQKQQITVTVELVNRLTGQVKSKTALTTYSYTNYLHNNWGQHGRNNGYYVAGGFNYNAGANMASNTKSGADYNYQYNIDIYPNIYR